MLPPDFAAFSFQTDAAGGDEALADRTVTAIGPTRIAIAGAGRWNLVLELARRAAHVVAFDPSRLVLSTARDAATYAGLADKITFFAADPRDVVIPDGVDGALVTSFPWRVLLTPEAQRQTLDCLRHAIVPGGALCLDVDRLPPKTPAETERTLLRHGPGGQTWWWRCDPARGLVTVTCEAPRTGPIEVALSDASPEAAAAALRSAGFLLETEPAPGEPRAFLVAGTPVP